MDSNVTLTKPPYTNDDPYPDPTPFPMTTPTYSRRLYPLTTPALPFHNHYFTLPHHHDHHHHHYHHHLTNEEACICDNPTLLTA